MVDLEKAAMWLKEAAEYFESRPVNGEDRAHWANVYNAENARKIAALITELEAARAQLTWNPDMEAAPRDRLLMLAWLNQTLPGREHWEYEIDFAHNTAGGWHHGQATHWRLIGLPPAAPEK